MSDVLTIEEIKQRIAPLMRQNEVRRAYLFGSYARGEATADSDVDLRVDLTQNKKLYGIFQLAGFRENLAAALGKEVDLLPSFPRGPLAQAFLANLAKDELMIYAS